LFGHEAGVEPLSGVTRVGRHDGESTDEARHTTAPNRAKWKLDASVQPSAALKQKAPIPFSRKSQSETDPVELAVSSRSAIEHAIETTEGG
jgi:hypothetical protein